MIDPDVPRWYLYLIFFVLILAGGFFAAAETAFSYSNKFKLKVRADDGSKRAIVALRIVGNPDKALTTVMIGNNIIHICASVLGSLLMIDLLKSEAAGSLLATVVTTLLVFVFSETIPKNIARSNCDKLSLWLAYPTYFFMIILTPVSIIFQGIILGVRKLLKNKEEDPVMSEDDFTDIIESIEEEGVLDEEESDIIQAAVEFGDIAVKEVLTPKERIVALSIASTDSEIIDFLSKNKYSRYPVYDGNIDNIIGTLHFRNYLKLREGKKSLYEIISPVYKVPANVTLDDMFEGFKTHKTHIAIVTDIIGNTLGMVTMEDVLEELVDGISEPSQEVGL